MCWVCENVIHREPDGADRGTRVGEPERESGISLADGPLDSLQRLPDLRAVDLYQPVNGGTDPFVQDGPGPVLIAILDFPSPEALRSATEGPEFAGALSKSPYGAGVQATALERRFYPIGGQTEGYGWTAPVSYVVRYHRPAEDEASFVANYVATHPPTLAKLPGIRAIMCYFPRPDLGPPDVPRADYMIGNEVAFESVEAFNAAMASPVRQELRAHYREFPPFTGANTHSLMRRRRILG